MVLASGAIPPNPSELLTSREFEELLEWAAENFDTVIIDAPPLLPVADAVVISRMATGLLLVIDASKVRRAQLRKAVETVRLGGGKIVGSVLNRAKVAAADNYAYERKAPTRPKRHRKADRQAALREVTPETAWIEWPPAASEADQASTSGDAAPSPVAAGREPIVPEAVCAGRRRARSRRARRGRARRGGAGRASGPTWPMRRRPSGRRGDRAARCARGRPAHERAAADATPRGGDDAEIGDTPGSGEGAYSVPAGEHVR